MFGQGIWFERAMIYPAIVDDLQRMDYPIYV